MNRKRIKGRINLIIVFGLFGLLAIAGLLFFAKASPESAAIEFMDALARKDVDRLVQLSFLESSNKPLKEQWDECVNKYAKHFNFVWEIENSIRNSGDRATVRVEYYKFQGPAAGLEGPFELPLVEKDGKWRVDLSSLSKEFFPALPG